MQTKDSTLRCLRALVSSARCKLTERASFQVRMSSINGAHCLHGKRYAASYIADGFAVKK